MSILSRNALKAEFISGTAATESKFGDLFDSSFNLNDDSVVLGPTGITGTYGLWFTALGATPVSLSATGSTGQIAAGASGIWLCIAQNSWILVPTSPSLGGTVTGHIVPETDVTYDLGATGYRFRDLYISGTTIYMGNSSMSTDDQGNFLFAGPTGGTTVIGPSGSNMGGTVTSPLVFAEGSSICSSANSSGDDSGLSTMILKPDASIESDQYLVIDPTGPNHIHIRAGGTVDASNADLFIGAENTHLRVSDQYKEVEMFVETVVSSDQFYFDTNSGYSTATWGSSGGNYTLTFNDPNQDMYNATSLMNGVSTIEVFDGTNYQMLNFLGSLTPGGNQPIIIDVDIAPPSSPTTIQTAVFFANTIGDSYIRVDGSDIRMYAADDLRMFSNDILSINNLSPDGTVRISTDDENNNWYFTSEGDIEFPNGSKQKVAYPGVLSWVNTFPNTIVQNETEFYRIDSPDLSLSGETNQRFQYCTLTCKIKDSKAGNQGAVYLIDSSTQQPYGFYMVGQSLYYWLGASGTGVIGGYSQDDVLTIETSINGFKLYHNGVLVQSHPYIQSIYLARFTTYAINEGFYGIGFNPISNAPIPSLSYGPGPVGPTAPGATGQMILETVLGASPELGFLYIYDPTNSRWVRFTGAAWDW